MAYDWYQLFHVEEAKEDRMNIESESEAEEQNGIQDNDDEMDIQENKVITKEADENEDTADPEFEEANVDVGDDEDLFDEEGKPIVIESIAPGL